MTTALFVLRAYQMGLSIKDLEQMEYGFVFDMIIESSNDDAEYENIARQEDFDKF